MIGKVKATGSVETSRTKVGTIIGQGAIFDGNLSAPETIRVDGSVNGDCSCSENLILGPDGEINGNISAQNIIISGKVEGDVSATGKLEILSTGKLTGNITARSLVIDEDAYFDGRCTMAAGPKEEPPKLPMDKEEKEENDSAKNKKK